jgi:hypothetical protein
MDSKEAAINELLIKDIKKGKSVLFLGPELLVNQEGKYYKTYFKQLADDNKQMISKYFSKENLFAFQGSKSAIDQRMVAIKVTKFYEEAGDESILNLISQLPFPLIINVSPDTALNKLFTKNNYNYRAAYFPDPRSSNIDQPTIASPIIYNIFGSIEEEQSIIMTHTKLFETIIELMQKDSIPVNIRDFMKTANSFIFLGMKFETWYYQLLLSILGFNNASATIKVGAPQEADMDTVSVMDSCFKIDFSSLNPFSIIENLYKTIKKDNPAILKQPQKPEIAGSAYISYAWRDAVNADTSNATVATTSNVADREDIVDNIYNELTTNYGVSIFRDKNVLTLQDSIQSFMNRIGQGKVVIIVVSHKYLRSEYCMYEAWEIYKNDRFKDRAFVVVLPDVNLGNQEQYINYWRNRQADLANEIKEKFGNDYLAADKLMAKNKTLFYIYLFIGTFIEILRDTINSRLLKDDQQANDATLKKLVNKIVAKLKEE